MQILQFSAFQLKDLLATLLFPSSSHLFLFLLVISFTSAISDSCVVAYFLYLGFSCVFPMLANYFTAKCCDIFFPCYFPGTYGTYIHT